MTILLFLTKSRDFGSYVQHAVKTRTSTAAIGNSSTTRVPQHLLLPYLLLHLLLVQEPEPQPQLFLLPAQLHYYYYYILHLLPNPTTTTTIAKIIALLPALHLIVAPQIWFPPQLSLLHQWEVLSPPFLLSCGFAGREKEPAAAVAAWIQAPLNPHTACCLGWEEWEERSVVAEVAEVLVQCVLWMCKKV